MALQNEKKIELELEDGNTAIIELSDTHINRISQMAIAIERNKEEVVQALIEMAKEKYRTISQSRDKRIPKKRRKSIQCFFEDLITEYEKFPEGFLVSLNTKILMHIYGKSFAEVDEYGDIPWQVYISFVGNDPHVKLYGKDRTRMHNMIDYLCKHTNLTEIELLSEIIKCIGDAHKDTNKDAKEALLDQIDRFEEYRSRYSRLIFRAYYGFKL